MTANGPRWQRLTNAAIRELDPDDDLAVAIRDFVPLDFPGGWAASNWLKTCLRERTIALETHLVRGDDPQELLGFYVVRPAAFNLSNEDRILLGLRRKVSEQPQPGAMLELIARHRETSGGFGNTMIVHALASAIAADAVALLVEASRDAADRVWRRHRFMPFRPEQKGPGDMTLLWHPVDEPKAGGWPS